MKRTYLDFAAGVVGNPSSPHEEGREAKNVLEAARRDIAELIEVQADDVIFTSGATESNALAILGHVRALRELAGPDAVGRNNMHVLYLPSAHASVVKNVKLLAKEGIAIEALPIQDARVDTDMLAKMLRTETVLVTMDAVCGETGVVWNTREVAEIVQRHRERSFSSLARDTAAAGEENASFAMPQVASKKSASVVLHIDASQAPLTEKITRAHFGADLLSFDGAKVGARGTGVLIAHRTIPLVPLYQGGGQERGLRPGTAVPEFAKAFADALRAATALRETFRTTATNDRTQLVAGFTASVPDIFTNEGRAQAPNILNFSLLGRDTDYLVALLDEAGFAVSTKSACEIDSLEGSRAVFALTGDRERALSTVRISWGPGVSWRALSRFAHAFTRAVQFIDTNASG